MYSIISLGQWKWQNPLPQGNALRSVFFTDINTGYAVGDCNTILKTTDGGISWANVSDGFYSGLESIYFTSSTPGYVGGWYGILLKTTNMEPTDKWLQFRY
jgi:photosystem II stability/assembly factor-like uncharacterized protein